MNSTRTIQRAVTAAAAIVLALGLAASPATAAIPPCSYGNYFNSAGQQIKPTPIETVGSQRGKAWCVGFGRFVYPSDWVSNQRLYEITTGR